MCGGSLPGRGCDVVRPMVAPFPPYAPKPAPIPSAAETMARDRQGKGKGGGFGVVGGRVRKGERR